MTHEEQQTQIGAILTKVFNAPNVRGFVYGALLLGVELTVFVKAGCWEIVREHIPASIGPSVLGVDVTLRASIVECAQYTANLLCRHTVPREARQNALRFERSELPSAEIFRHELTPATAAPEPPEQPAPIETRWTEWEPTGDGGARREVGPLTVVLDAVAWSGRRQNEGQWEISQGDRVIERGDGCDRSSRVASHAMRRANLTLAHWARSALRELQERIVDDRDTERREADCTDESDLFRMEHRGAADALNRVVEKLGVMIALEP